MGKRVLVIEDCDEMQDLYQTVLKVQGYEVIQAADGLEGIEALQDGPRPDVVVLDISMPRMSGWGVLEVVRGTPGWDDIPILVVTALGQPTNVHRGWAMGATSYLSKPVAIDELMLMIDRLILVGADAAPQHAVG